MQKKSAKDVFSCGYSKEAAVDVLNTTNITVREKLSNFACELENATVYKVPQIDR